MKKYFGIIAIMAVLLVSCGPSTKQLEEKRISDSIAVADSFAMVQTAQQKVADSIALVQAETKKADSIAKAALAKPVKKVKAKNVK